MKIVIQTQFCENYGDADKPYWKFKGGETYVVPNLTPAQVEKVKSHGIPTLTAMIEYSNDGSKEYIIGFNVVEDSKVVCEEWETPFELFWEEGRWVARRTVENGEFGYMRSDIASKSEQYDMMMEGGREKYSAMYTMRTGEVLTSKELETFYRQAA
jgi:hypothetical protein